jgi:hypothetical protein
MEKKPSQPVVGTPYWRIVYEQAIARRPHESSIAYALRLMFETTATIGAIGILIGVAVEIFVNQGRGAEFSAWTMLGSRIVLPSTIALWMLDRDRRHVEQEKKLEEAIDQLRTEIDELRILKEQEPESWSPATAPESLAS